jgi:hypothetical protein
MRTLSRLLVCFLFCGSLTNAEEKKDDKLDSLTTLDGKTYSNVTIREINSEGLRILHESGAATVAFDKLPQDLQDRYKSKSPEKEAQAVVPQITLEQACTPIPITEWVGHKFIFMPTFSEYEQNQGYVIKKSPTSNISYIPYKQYLGKFITVYKVEKQPGSFSSSYNVYFQVDATGERMITTTLLSNVKGLMLKRDYDYAVKEFTGKDLWLKSNEATSLDPNADDFGSIRVKNLQKVTVTKIALADSESWPIRFFLKNSEGQQFSKVAKISGTNSDSTSRESYKFNNVFFTEDPRKTFNWNEKTFKAIEEEKLFVGMTKEQARISWGHPLEVNRTVGEYGAREQWVYGGQRYVYFDDDSLSAIQQ